LLDTRRILPLDAMSRDKAALAVELVETLAKNQ
jgi:hypothetical protein